MDEIKLKGSLPTGQGWRTIHINPSSGSRDTYTAERKSIQVDCRDGDDGKQAFLGKAVSGGRRLIAVSHVPYLQTQSQERFPLPCYDRQSLGSRAFIPRDGGPNPTLLLSSYHPNF